MNITTSTHTLSDNRTITAYTLHSSTGMSVEVLNLGCIITKILAPNRQGQFENVVLNFSDLDTYIPNPGHLGGLIGRFAGRISNGQVTLDNVLYQLPTGPNGHHIHGGKSGFDRKIWDANTEVTTDFSRVTFTYTSAHLEENFPGNLHTQITYTLRGNQLELSYTAHTDQTTLVNLTNHTYFNLSGDAKQTALDHQLFLNSEKLICLDKASIPTGTLLDLNNTPFDFSSPKVVGKDMHIPHSQFSSRIGYDHPWLLTSGDSLKASLYDDASGRKLEVYTDQKVMVVYTQNGAIESFSPHTGICFESQMPPIGYNEVHKNDSLLTPSKTYTQKTIWKFSTL